MLSDTPPDISIRIDAQHKRGPCEQVWNWFGYDEPNSPTL